MELQDFATQHLHSQLVFAEADGSVVDRRGAIAKAMRAFLDLPEASLDPTAAEVTTANKRDQYRIGIVQVLASLMDFTDFDEAAARTHAFFEMALGQLEDPRFERLVIRSYDVAPVESFEGMRDQLTATLARNVKGLTGAVGASVKDVAWVFEFADPSGIRVQFGPMESDQLRVMLRDQEAEKGTYPPSVLFLDVSSERKGQEHVGEEALDWWAKALDAHHGVATRIGEWLRKEIES